MDFTILNRTNKRRTYAIPRPVAMQFVIKDIYRQFSVNKSKGVKLKDITKDYLLHGPIPPGSVMPDMEEFVLACKLANSSGAVIFTRNQRIVPPKTNQKVEKDCCIRKNINQIIDEILNQKLVSSY